MGRRIAVIDVGTNTIRLLVSDVGEGVIAPIHTDKALVRLGRDLARHGEFSEELLGHVTRTLARFAAKAEELGAQPIRLLATSASREAANGPELALRARAATGIELEIIGEEEEARLAFTGALNALVEPWEGDVGVVDVGGGSTEIVVGSARDGIRWSRSFRLGSGRLTDIHIVNDPPGPAEIAAMRRQIDEVLPPSGEIPRPLHATAVAGSASNLRRLVGPLLDLEAINRALRITCDEPSERIAQHYDIEPERARILPAGALILHACSVRLGEPLWYSRGSIREGAVLEIAGLAGVTWQR